MMSPISLESIEQTAGILFCSSIGVHETLFITRRNKTTLHQTARHRRQTEHRQIVLLGTHILASRGLTDISLHVLGQFYAVLHVLVLDELKHDITLRRVRVISLIGLFVVFL